MFLAQNSDKNNEFVTRKNNLDAPTSRSGAINDHRPSASGRGEGAAGSSSDAARYGEKTEVPAIAERLRCERCGRRGG
jgi:hypothetical protein